MDEHQRLAFESEISYVVMGRGSECTLVRLGHGDAVESAAQARELGYRYCGALGLRDGVPVVVFEPDADSVFCCLAASLQFARLVCNIIRPMPKDDWLGFITRLYSLPDTRDDRAQALIARFRALSLR